MLGVSAIIVASGDRGVGGDPTDTEHRSNASKHNGCHDSNGKTRRE